MPRSLDRRAALLAFLLACPVSLSGQAELPPLPDSSGWGIHVLSVARDPRFDHWQSHGLRLRLQHRGADALHRDAFVFRSDGGQQPDHLDPAALAQRMQRPCRVLAAAPGQ